MKRFAKRRLWAAGLRLGCASSETVAGASTWGLLRRRALLALALGCGLSWGANAWAGNVGVGANVGLGHLYCLSGAAPLICANGPDAVAEMTIAGVNSKNDGIMNAICNGGCTYEFDSENNGNYSYRYMGPPDGKMIGDFAALLTGECASGYTRESDGTCQPRPPVQTCPISNPVIPGVGTKAYSESSEGGNADVPVTLVYRSASMYGVANRGGGQWMSNWQRSLDTRLTIDATPKVVAQRDNGSVSIFTQSGTTWTAPDIRDTLQSVTGTSGKITGWQYTVADTGAVETYDLNGKLQSMRDRNGRTTTLAYNAANQLTAVTGPSGRSTSFAFDSQNRIASVTAPDGTTTRYGYNTDGMLSSVTRADGSVRQYVYENSRFPTSLTGVIDENGSRYATYAYDDQGRAVSSAHAGGADTYQFQYGDNYQTTVTDPTGKTSVYSFLKQNGVLLPTSISAPCGLCGSTRKSSSYDANNNLTQETDYNGTVTTHAYDSQKREIQRVDGAGTASARTTTTEWHKIWNLPLRIASPTKLETYSYDSNGNLTRYSETPTADSDGSQGTGAAATGATRTTNWTYTAGGQVATSSGPRTDVATSTTYVYRTADDTNSPPLYRKGDLYQIIDPLGRTTTINRYDASGRPLQMTDANGIVTAFTYSNRGWLTRQTITPAGEAGQTTNYSYDAVGQLTKVTLPDGSSVSFTYDAAHRLTGAADSQGNSIAYVLDAMGNRTQEQVTDPNGVLTRRVDRVFDSMNRLLRVTQQGALPSGSTSDAPIKVVPAGITASSTSGDNVPARAIDGDPSAWIASGYPTQWIEVDLGAAVPLKKVRMLVSQSPAGQTTHVVTGGMNPAPTSVLQTLSGNTSDGQWLEAALDGSVSVRYIRITTTSSPSWVSWHELEFYR
ncbi:RHS repeat domain-containing protein [Ralstonia pseudosolanacearum]|uniref:RHS repeat domain-containing protein n=1 Tax=Ralstonia pseudosolanacearum TaxID=1310165 RepID=UPI0026759F74|nr:RHS repeat domain-containing protein [Ralstonia pseudosolanacearum]MDO3514964.1 RHS repeat domain-containing protein [Ralstonia pseudosolanacearum]MDO3539738.1 RHS repeat domain-containing protein [Ralstonia pseudosolanacearum]MDO3609039.1 RHS repeat domain-containing protein [Ralstonia pseudosolanacearum]MDO3613870.1 RHS repeat domain-containing protein [Ralstonia pseudosolanacearum]MDO3633683.1 RHS repeat domain-containing protein [Ralstonia pseudosolanacearum]